MSNNINTYNRHRNKIPNYTAEDLSLIGLTNIGTITHAIRDIVNNTVPLRDREDEVIITQNRDKILRLKLVDNYFYARSLAIIHLQSNNALQDINPHSPESMNRTFMNLSNDIKTTYFSNTSDDITTTAIEEGVLSVLVSECKKRISEQASQRPALKRIK